MSRVLLEIRINFEADIQLQTFSQSQEDRFSSSVTRVRRYQRGDLQRCEHEARLRYVEPWNFPTFDPLPPLFLSFRSSFHESRLSSPFCSHFHVVRIENQYQPGSFCNFTRGLEEREREGVERWQARRTTRASRIRGEVSGYLCDSSCNVPTPRLRWLAGSGCFKF